MQHIEKILKNDERVMQIVKLDYVVPEINYSNFDAKHRESAERFIRGIKPIFAGPFIFDNHNSHDERKQWRHALSEQYGNDMHLYLQSNGFRRGPYGGALRFIGMLGRISKNDAFSNRIHFVQDVQRELRNYHEKPVDERFVIADRIQHQIYSALLLLSY